MVPPRLSVTDLMLRKQYITVVDIRPAQEYAIQCLPHPFTSFPSISSLHHEISTDMLFYSRLRLNCIELIFWFSFASLQWPRSLNVPFIDERLAAPGDLQQLVRLANKNYAEANFNAFLLVVGATTAEETKVSCSHQLSSSVVFVYSEPGYS
jgi:rhodanese-related sulfurtransferase